MKPAHRRPMQLSAASGFTLLEVLVALIIVGTALSAALRAIGSLAQNSAGLRSALMATWSAENRLTQIYLSGEWPPVGERSYPCPQAELPLLCNERVVATPNPYFRRLEISVVDRRAQQAQIVKMTQVVSRGNE